MNFFALFFTTRPFVRGRITVVILPDLHTTTIQLDLNVQEWAFNLQNSLIIHHAHHHGHQHGYLLSLATVTQYTPSIMVDSSGLISRVDSSSLIEID